MQFQLYKLSLNIGFLDFSSTPEELAQQNSQELSSAMGTSFDGVDFYPTDDALRGRIHILSSSCFHVVFIYVSWKKFRWTRSDWFWRFANTDKLDVGNRSFDWRSFQIGPYVKVCSFVILSSTYGFHFVLSSVWLTINPLSDMFSIFHENGNHRYDLSIVLHLFNF